MPKFRPTCETCIYFCPASPEAVEVETKRLKNHAETANVLGRVFGGVTTVLPVVPEGECRRNCPTPFMFAGETSIASGFPAVTGQHWCGEYWNPQGHGFWSGVEDAEAVAG